MLQLFGEVAVPFMDRDACNMAQCQSGFLRFMVMPLYAAVAEVFPVLVQPLEQLKANQKRWQIELDKKEKQDDHASD